MTSSPFTPAPPAVANSCPYLTDDHIADLLSGVEPAASLHAHLAVCPPCRFEVDELRLSLTHFNDFALRWAEREAPQRIQTPSRWLLHLGRPMWGLGLITTTAAFLIAAITSLPGRHTPVPPATPAVATSEPSNTELADDNHLMLSIHQALADNTQLAVPIADLRDGKGAVRADGSAFPSPVID